MSKAPHKCNGPDEHREKCLEHVVFAVDHLREMRTLLKQPERLSKPILYACLDSFLVYYRCLAEFFSMRSSEKRHDADRAVAQDYCPSWSVRSFRETDRVNVRLSHISCEREYLSADWFCEPLADEIERAYREFYALLDDKWKPRFPEALPTLAGHSVASPGVSTLIGPAIASTSYRNTFSVIAPMQFPDERRNEEEH